MARGYRYVLLDVFTDVPLSGNQLAVFLNAERLSDAEMQGLARETNLSETTFCFPDEQDAVQGVRVRIFTTQEELPFAGHPMLGTAAALRWALPSLRGATRVSLRLNAGVVPVLFKAGQPAGSSAELPFGQACFGEMEQPLPRFGRKHDPAAVAAALGLPLEALDAGKPIQTVSTGIAFVIVPLVSREALGMLEVPRQTAEAYLGSSDGKFFYVLAPGANVDRWQARMQFYNGEDPATGSAAGCATAYLVEHGYAHAGAPLVIEQGIEMGRKSVLYCSAAKGRETVGGPNWDAGSYVRVGGSTVPVAEGRFFLP